MSVPDPNHATQEHSMITLARTGKRPLMFEGMLLTQISSDDPNNSSKPFHNIGVYQTTGGKYIPFAVYRSGTNWETDFHAVDICDTQEAIENFFNSRPAWPSGTDSQLVRSYNALVTELYRLLGPKFAEVVE